MGISAEDRKKLVDLARSGVEARVTGNPLPKVQNPQGLLAEKRGCFVTLTNRGRLRGCIGTFTPDAPLGEMIVQMGAAAARDPRFVTDPITPEELGELTVEVSVLSPLTRSDQPETLTPGRDGVYIIRGGRAGCFLPEVATQMGWDAEQFLDNCCTHKAGLPAGAWREPDTQVYLFTSEKFEQ